MIRDSLKENMDSFNLEKIKEIHGLLGMCRWSSYETSKKISGSAECNYGSDTEVTQVLTTVVHSLDSH